MTTEQKKIAAISKIADLQNERLLDEVTRLLEISSRNSLPEPGWAKGIITSVSEDFDDFIPPGFNGEDEDKLLN